MILLKRAGAALLIALGACSGESEVAAPVVPEPALTAVPAPPPAITVPKRVAAVRAEILIAAEAGSLGGLERIALRADGFVSNFGGQGHRNFWELMRKIGVDPNVRLRTLLAQSPGVREVDGVRWYVWPDLAAKDAGDLIPEKLSFEDRARLTQLIGEDGIARIRNGEGYPGMRTAISEDGDWIYYVLGLDGED
jgi:hypothetical protein